MSGWQKLQCYSAAGSNASMFAHFRNISQWRFSSDGEEGAAPFHLFKPASPRSFAHSCILLSPEWTWGGVPPPTGDPFSDAQRGASSPAVPTLFLAAGMAKLFSPTATFRKANPCQFLPKSGYMTPWFCPSQVQKWICHPH